MTYRNLTPEEIDALKCNGCVSSDWTRVAVSDPFDPTRMRQSQLEGDVRIGNCTIDSLTNKGLRLPTGIYNSFIVNSTVGDNMAIHNVRMLANHTIGSCSILFNIDEMTADSDYKWMEPMNECGGRRILPFGGMRIGDAYLWAKYRDKSRLMEALERMTLKQLSTQHGAYGNIGECCVVTNSRRLHNVSILSCRESPTKITGAEILSDGVVGYGNLIEYGVMAMRFLLGENVTLEMGARINDTIVGDNSTIARCEVGSSLIFPSHQQHHNNSFLIASLVMGQSNIAAGATIGSNHNSRAADNELVAGRGFWPALCTSLKHPSRFASYCLIAKGSYPNELDVPLPFALVSNNESRGQLEIMPAYWWLYNIYALQRNQRKFADRDRRHYKLQHIETSPLAPDTAEEIVCGRELLRHWTEQAYLASIGSDKPVEVLASTIEKGRRKVVVLKAAQGYAAYEEMLIYYCMTALLDGNRDDISMPKIEGEHVNRERRWVNFGGQLIAGADADRLIADIEDGRIADWDAIHDRFDQLWHDYPMAKRRHAYQLLCDHLGKKQIDSSTWQNILNRYNTICAHISEQVRNTQTKDQQNPYRRMNYSNDQEMLAVLGE